LYQRFSYRHPKLNKLRKLLKRGTLWGKTIIDRVQNNDCARYYNAYQEKILNEESAKGRSGLFQNNPKLILYVLADDLKFNPNLFLHLNSLLHIKIFGF
jgi:hypothetical protein